MANYLGTVIDNRYEMIEIIGTGGMSCVYKARDTKLNRYVAVKILKDEIMQDEELRSRFHNEAEAVAALSHPNIVSIYDVSMSRKLEYFVMELIDGITLKQYMQQRGILSEAEVQHFTLQILKALEHAHSRNVIHRDIKPQNIMILRDGTVKVTDFGIARMTDRQQTMTQNAFGSVHYIAPEQAKGGLTDGRTDIYSVGIIMYEMVTGELPFTGDTPVAVAIQHLNTEPPAPSAKNANITPGMEAIILKAMATEPKDRYVSATAMVDDIELYKSNPSLPVGLYRGNETEFEVEDEEESTPTKLVGHIEQNEEGEYVTSSPKTVRRQKAKFKYNEKLPIVAGILSAVVFLIVAVVFFLSFLRGCSTDTGESITLPNLTGKTYEAVVEELAASPDYQYLKIKKGEEVYTDDVEAGLITDQNPAAYSQVKSNATISVTISLGIKEIMMIEMSGYEYSEGINKLNTLLTQNKLTHVSITPVFEESETVPANQVISTEPALGEAIHSGDTIIIHVSSGTEKQEVPMPNLYGMKLADAVKLLQSYKITLRDVTEQFDTTEAGLIIGQSIAKDSAVNENDVVDLIISKGPEPVESESESESDTTSESESDSQIKQGSAQFSFDPSALASTKQEDESFTVTIKANDQTVYSGKGVTTGSTAIDVTHSGNVGEDCKFEVYIDNILYTTYVGEYQ